MLTWPEVVQRVAAGDPHDLDLRQRRFGVISGTPLAIAGSSGAGKTRIWSRLTTRISPDQASAVTDDGYMVRPHKRTLTLTTIPGQQSRIRRFTLMEIFGEDTRLHGVIYVACHGYDHIWPKYADVVANNLLPHKLEALRERNRRKELDGFKEICNEIVYKDDCAPRGYAPRWLLVVVNKMDLFWNELQSAERYYLPGCNSDFDAIAQELIDDVGSRRLEYYVMPLATQTSAYNFRSSRGNLAAQSQLSSVQCDASVRCLVDALAALCGE
jgi:hypothetical protein